MDCGSRTGVKEPPTSPPDTDMEGGGRRVRRAQTSAKQFPDRNDEKVVAPSGESDAADGA